VNLHCGETTVEIVSFYVYIIFFSKNKAAYSSGKNLNSSGDGAPNSEHCSKRDNGRVSFEKPLLLHRGIPTESSESFSREIGMYKRTRDHFPVNALVSPPHSDPYNIKHRVQI